jgi:hypothetical protein
VSFDALRDFQINFSIEAPRSVDAGSDPIARRKSPQLISREFDAAAGFSGIFSQ